MVSDVEGGVEGLHCAPQGETASINLTGCYVRTFLIHLIDAVLLNISLPSSFTQDNQSCRYNTVGLTWP